jgi:hypothetical protein
MQKETEAAYQGKMPTEKMEEMPTEGRMQKGSLKKYLITWNLVLGREDLEKISRRPDVLQKGLKYIKSTARKNALIIYRIASMEEVTHFGRPVYGARAESSHHPTGIAIAEATSVEEVRKMVNNWVEGLGFGFGAVPVKNYLEYDIKPLVEITAGGRQ